MNHTSQIEDFDELPEEIDFSDLQPDWEQTKRRREAALAHLVRLEPDLIEFFKTPEAINEALRQVMQDRQRAA